MFRSIGSLCDSRLSDEIIPRSASFARTLGYHLDSNMSENDKLRDVFFPKAMRIGSNGGREPCDFANTGGLE